MDERKVTQEYVQELEEALREIAYSKYCNYEETVNLSRSPGGYGTGVTDGHRYCARIARKALG